MKIAILSKGAANYTTRRLKEEALKRGHEVKIVNYAKCYMTIERGNPVVYYKGKILDDYDAIIPRIAQSYTKYGCAVVRQFEMRDVYTTAKSIAIEFNKYANFVAFLRFTDRASHHSLFELARPTDLTSIKSTLGTKQCKMQHTVPLLDVGRPHRTGFSASVYPCWDAEYTKLRERDFLCSADKYLLFSHAHDLCYNISLVFIFRLLTL